MKPLQLFTFLFGFIAQVSYANILSEKLEFKIKEPSGEATMILDEAPESLLKSFVLNQFKNTFLADKDLQVLQVTAPAGYRFWLDPRSSSGIVLHRSLLQAFADELQCTEWKRDTVAPLALLNKSSSKLVEAAKTYEEFLSLVVQPKESIRPTDLIVYTCENQFTDSNGTEYGYDYQLFILDPSPRISPDLELRMILTEEKWIE